MAKMMENALFVLVLSTAISIAYGHVSLTFPPARKYDLDFLDNSRTPAPCGMPKGRLFLLLLHCAFDAKNMNLLIYGEDGKVGNLRLCKFLYNLKASHCCIWKRNLLLLWSRRNQLGNT